MDNDSPSGGDLCSTPESSKKSQNHTPNSVSSLYSGSRQGLHSMMMKNMYLKKIKT